MPAKSSFLDELKSLAVQGRDDFVLALQRPSPDSMQLTPAPTAPPEQTVTHHLGDDFQAVLAKYAKMGQSLDTAERGMER